MYQLVFKMALNSVVPCPELQMFGMGKFVRGANIAFAWAAIARRGLLTLEQKLPPVFPARHRQT